MAKRQKHSQGRDGGREGKRTSSYMKAASDGILTGLSILPLSILLIFILNVIFLSSISLLFSPVCLYFFVCFFLSLSLSSCPLPLAETVTLGLSGTECRGALRQKRQRDSHEGREAGRTAAALLWLCPHPTPSPSAASSENVPQALLDPQASSRRLGDPLLACHHYSTPICNICLCSSFASYHPLCHSPALAPPPHPLLGLCHQDAQQQW